MKGIPFEDRFGMLVDIEYSNRKSNSLKRLIHNAGFDQPDAYIGDINYTSGRKLNRSLIERLATCEYITEHRNLFITGATGSGKTYLAVRGKVILQPHGKEFFTWYSKHLFTLHGKHFFT